MTQDPKKQHSFNDVLDAFSPEFTPTEKLTGLVTLPADPILHPIKTVKGVFETYGKLSSIPLAVYSGNINKIPGIIEGTEHVTGRDVLAKIENKDPSELHGILPAMAGFGIDLAADPFIGVARLPEEVINTTNHLILQSAAPGFPQAVNKLGLMAKLGRYTGTGSGTGNDITAAFINPDVDLATGAQDMSAVRQQQNTSTEAKNQMQQLASSNIKPYSYKLDIPWYQDEKLGSTPYVNNIYNFQAGSAKMSGVSAEQIQADTAELERMTAIQDEHREYTHTIDYMKDFMSPQQFLEKSEIGNEANILENELKSINENIKALGGDAEAIKTHPELVKMKKDIMAGLSSPRFADISATSRFGDADVPLLNAHRFIKNNVSLQENAVMKYFSRVDGIPSYNKGTKTHTLKFDDLMFTDQGWIRSSKFRSNPKAYISISSESGEQLNKAMTNKSPDRLLFHRDGESIFKTLTTDKVEGRKGWILQDHNSNTTKLIRSSKEAEKWEKLLSPTYGVELESRAGELTETKARVNPLYNPELAGQYSLSQAQGLETVESTNLPKYANAKTDVSILSNTIAEQHLTESELFNLIDGFDMPESEKDSLTNWFEKRLELQKEQFAVSYNERLMSTSKRDAYGDVVDDYTIPENDSDYGYEIAKELLADSGDIPINNMLDVSNKNYELLDDMSNRETPIKSINPIDYALENGLVSNGGADGEYIVEHTFTLPRGLKPAVKTADLFQPELMNKFATDLADSDVITNLINTGDPAKIEIANETREFLSSYHNNPGKTDLIFRNLNNLITDAIRDETLLIGDEGSEIENTYENVAPLAILDEIIQPLKERSLTSGGVRSNHELIENTSANFIKVGNLPKDLNGILNSNTFKKGDKIKIPARFAKTGRSVIPQQTLVNISDGFTGVRQLAIKSGVSTADFDTAVMSFFETAQKPAGLTAKQIDLYEDLSNSLADQVEKGWANARTLDYYAKKLDFLKKPIQTRLDWLNKRRKNIKMYEPVGDWKPEVTTYEIATEDDPWVLSDFITKEVVVDTDQTLDVMSNEAVTNELQDKIDENIIADIDSATNLGAEQLLHYTGIQQKNVTVYDRVKSDFDAADEALELYASKQKSPYTVKKRIKENAVRRMYQNHEITIPGSEFGKQLLKRNYSLSTSERLVPGVTQQFQEYADTLNSQIGHDLFTVEKHYAPNSHMISLRLNHEGLKSRQALKALADWQSKAEQGSTGFRDFKYKATIKPAKELKAVEQGLADAQYNAMVKANQELIDILNFENLNDQISFTADEYFPHVLKGVQADSEKLMSKLTPMESIQAATYMKRRLKISGAFSATAADRSVIGTPFDLYVNKTGRMETLFSADPSKAYRQAFAKAFADHTEVRVAREIMFHPKYHLSNMNILDLPETATADFDVLIPKRSKSGGLIDIKSYPPTKANIKRYKNSGYLISKTVSAEARSLLKYQNLTAKSPAYQWYTKNILGSFKRGVLMNLAFPVGNAGDMWYKTLAGTPFSKWSEYHKNVASSYHTIMSHGKTLQQYAALREMEGANQSVRELNLIQYANDSRKFLESGGVEKADWMTHTPGYLESLNAKIGDTDEINKLNNTVLYEVYSSLPLATSEQRAIFLEQGKVKARGFNQDFADFLEKQELSWIGRVGKKVTQDAWFAKKINNFNGNLENAFRFSQWATDTGVKEKGLKNVVQDHDLQFMVNESLKMNHMHFAEMTGDAVWATAIMPFWQFPVKNLTWWARFISKKPHVAGQIYKLKKDTWGDDDNSFWAKLGAMPITDKLYFKTMPGMQSYSTFAMGLDSPTDQAGNRLSPILRPFFSSRGNAYKSYSVDDRSTHRDSILAAMLHGANPIESNVQGWLGWKAKQDKPFLSRVAPSLFSQPGQYINKKDNQ